MMSLKSPHYKCAACGNVGVRLWRTDRKVLGCIKCIVKYNNLRLSIQDTDYGSTKKIAGYYPAVPKDDGDGFYEYGFAATEAMKQWKLLPKYK